MFRCFLYCYKVFNGQWKLCYVKLFNWLFVPGFSSQYNVLMANESYVMLDYWIDCLSQVSPHNTIFLMANESYVMLDYWIDCLLQVSPHKFGAFSTWKVLLNCDRGKESNYSRLLAAGGATVLNIK